MKQTIQIRYHAKVSSFMGEDGTVADAATALKNYPLPRSAGVHQCQGHKQSPGHPCPAISEEEEQLQTMTRRILSQLRSGFSASLEDYKHRIGLFASNFCPCCRQAEHSVQHVFECPAYPTDLQPLDL